MTIRTKHYDNVLVRLVVILSLLVLVGVFVPFSLVQLARAAEEELLTSDPNQQDLSGGSLQNDQEIALRDIIVEKSGTSEALKAERQLVNFLTASGRSLEAQTELVAMITTYAGHERLPHTFNDLVRDAHEQGTSEVLGTSLVSVLDQNPGSTGALWLKMALTLNDAYAGADDQVRPAIDQIIRDYASDPGVSEAVAQVAWQYRLLDKPAQAQVYYEMVLEKWPDNPRAIYHQRGLVYTLLAQGDKEKAWAAVNDLFSKYGDHEKMADIIVPMTKFFRKQGLKTQAKELDKYLLEHFPDDPRTIDVRKSLVYSLLSRKDQEGAWAAVDDIREKFGDRTQAARALVYIAQKYSKLGFPDKAQSLFEYVEQRFPDDPLALTAHHELVLMHIKIGDDAAVEQEIDDLLSRYTENNLYAKRVCRVARHLQQAGKPSEGLYEAVLAECSEKTDSLDTQLNVAVAHAALGDSQACATVRSRLLEDFKNDPELPTALSTLAEAIYFQGQMAERAGDKQKAGEYFQTATAEWQDLIERFPEDKESPRIHLCLADAYRHKGDMQQAFPHFEAVARQWPNYRDTWYAHFMVGRYYEQRVTQGLESRETAAEKIRAAYQAVVQQFPKSPAVQAATNRLQQWDDLQEGEQK